MRPDFGTSAEAYVFENNDVLLEENIRTEVFNALAKYEPRIIVTGITAVREGTEITLTIFYIIKAMREATSTTLQL